MRIRCAWHLQFFGYVLMMGEKEPLDDPDTTDGICPVCYFLLMIEALVDKIEKGTNSLRRAKELI